MKTRYFLNLIAQNNRLNIAIDTEFEATHTLTIQAAVRTDPNRMNVQVYHCPDFKPPAHSQLHNSSQEVQLNRLRPITAKLSPGRLVADLFGLVKATSVDRKHVTKILTDRSKPLSGATWDQRLGRWRVPAVHIVLVGHFLAADLIRVFGREFNEQLLLQSVRGQADVKLVEHRKLGFATTGESFGAHGPILDYVQVGKQLLAIRVQTCDLQFVFGRGSLEALCKTFLGRGKTVAMSSEEKSSIAHLLQDDPVRVLRYAIGDAVDTLRVYEAMRQADRRIYEKFGVAAKLVPEMRATCGSRVATFTSTLITRELQPSSELPSVRAIRKHMHQSGQRYLTANARGRFGPQTFAVHGGLQFSRSPHKLWHTAPGMFRDVDLKGCYPAIMRTMNVYWGRPVLLEPGSRIVTLGDGVKEVQKISPPDGWYLRVTGNVDMNPLIPSTRDAITSDNYRRRSTATDKYAGAKLYAKRIESGVVTADTWQAIQLLPKHVRRQFEQLRVESMVFYPNQLVASSTECFDSLYAKHKSTDLPWKSILNLNQMEIEHRDKLDHDNVAYAFNLGVITQQLEQLRREARLSDGKGSAADLAMKVQVNSLYGILASPHYYTSNVVAANVITAAARARAFVLAMALNGLMVITDGVIYRADRIPRESFAHLMRKDPDYPLHFWDQKRCRPAHEVPDDDAAFAAWFPGHAAEFFGVEQNEFSRLFEFEVEHKLTGAGQSPCFDGLACDGSANHIKSMQHGDRWESVDAKMRGFGEASKEQLVPQILHVYANDNYNGPFPVTSDINLLRLQPALQAVYRLPPSQNRVSTLPLGFEHEIVKSYRSIKLSAFVFDAPRQERAITRQVKKFEDSVGPIDLLALRQRTHGSLSTLAMKIELSIREGNRDLTQRLNLSPSHISKYVERTGKRWRSNQVRRKKRAEQKLSNAITSAKPPITGLVLHKRQIPRLKLLMATK